MSLLKCTCGAEYSMDTSVPCFHRLVPRLPSNVDPIVQISVDIDTIKADIALLKMRP